MKYSLTRATANPYGYRYNVQALTRLPGEASYLYCGNGRYFRHLLSALKYILHNR